ncbi:hypothetical protein FV232_17170 [Methylobacterium sp. WL30]|uniref:hypothetical protein n=1 Tax=unclassified Methylobacterium TaxID=2615210 RepID=UPI0011CB2322|nr:MULTISPECIES: hypothetical protein [unclassified Methylobacterium]TXN41712.1 hypothetical protein FV225_01590 [Methylobacterium sp. WL93]TXN51050.1 hypothetical protein FV227_09560 [Methylobacterium sp. WL119]TXN65822.1 hypothetical protein FV232_17170 [Methylobacterium sp. WL30]TXN75111.1 hypothetical protein FV228_04435 [Methylobacterium sp. WL18]
MNTYIRIDTPAYGSIYAVATEEEALDLFAKAAGYRDYAELAATLGKSVEEARDELVISRVTADDIVRDIVEEGIENEVMDSWKVDEIAELNGLDRGPLVAAADAMQTRRMLENYNAQCTIIAQDRVRRASSLDEVYAELLLVRRYFGADGLSKWLYDTGSGEVPTFGPAPVDVGSLISWDAERVIVRDENAPDFSICIESRLDVAA